jgi:streptomycin 6-kinase
MRESSFQLGSLQRRRAELLGPEGQAWIDRLPDLISDLQKRWRIRIGSGMAGGTEGLVLAAMTEEGVPVVLKLGQPGSLAQEICALEIAGGVGYAKLLVADEGCDAILLERLGPKLIDSGKPTAEQLEIVVQTVSRTWLPVANPARLMTGAEKAQWHLNWLVEQWPALGEPCSRAVIDQGLAFCREREDAFEAEASVLVHGDSHAWNTLAVPGRVGEFKLVDPDGYFMEPAYDLGISMREWIDEYLAGDAVRIGRARAAKLSALTGVPEVPIWQWGYIEVISTALVYSQLGESALAAPYYDLAERWLSA